MTVSAPSSPIPGWRLARALVLALAMAPLACSPPVEAAETVATDPPEEIHTVNHALPTPEEIAAAPPDGGEQFNRLIHENSTYLLQHARNPVDWYPWGEEAFARARELDRPIFLSIGYATCHWCHVMERESFEDDAIAAAMNEAFVNIKVDREERPDVDHVYMNAAMVMNGSGGWPLTVAMTPDGKPFFVGTYIPRDSAYGRPGMSQLVPAIQLSWANERDAVLGSADQITAVLGRLEADYAGEGLDASVLEAGYRQLSRRFDVRNGGFGDHPKFPSPHQLSFLMRYHHRTGDERALQMVDATLDQMARGGLHDQLGGGFHRYSTDAQWLVPHFEKMLYDQAMLSIAYSEAYQVTGNEDHARAARGIYEYVLRDMTDPGGGFYSAEDADSEGEEGRFYLWTEGEIREVLGADDGELFVDAYGIRPDGNFIDPVVGHKDGRNIPHLNRPLATVATRHGVELEALRSRLDGARGELLARRDGRVRPLRDDKILVGWNGLMIAGMAIGARALDEPRYADAARRSADFVLANLRDERGRLLRSYRNGKAAHDGQAEEYVFVAWGLLELYETTYETRYLRGAQQLTDQLLTHFSDEQSAGFYMTPDDGEKLLVRGRDIHDGAMPSANAVAADVLLRLTRLTGDPAYERRAEALFGAFAAAVTESPSNHTAMLSALERVTSGGHEVVVAGDPAAADTRVMLAALQRPFLPDTVVVLRPDGDADIVALAPYAASQRSLDGAATAYVCRSHACEAPTTDVKIMLRALGVEGR